MPLDINVQINIIVNSLLAGLIVGTLFDLYRIVRGKSEIKVIIAIQDILFWILCAISIFVFLLYKNYGFFMPYVYLFIGISLIFYLKLISPIIFNFELFLISSVNKTLRISFKHISYPFRLIWAKMCNKE